MQKMKKLLLAATCIALAYTPASADKIDDSFVKEVVGIWCYSKSEETAKTVITTYTRNNSATKKRCSKSDNEEWISVNNVAGFSDSEYSCVALEGGDYRKVRGRWIFKFKHRCAGEGHRWVSTTTMRINETGNLIVEQSK
jgi:hypothetical protein